MKRKDTIILAAAINGVLLTILFVSALKRGPSESPSRAEQVTEEIMPLVVASTAPVAPEKEKKLGLDFTKELEAITQAASVATARKSAQPKTSLTQVSVQKGDVLEKIARTHDTTVSEIMRCNGMSSTVLQIGQTLKLPQKKGQVSSSKPGYYTVKPGDNPWTISVKNKIKVDELLKLNNLNEEKARKLRPGDRLRIR